MIILPYFAWLTQNPPVVPKLYFGAISQEQRLAEICKKIYGIEGYLKYLSHATQQLEDDIRREVQDVMAAAIDDMNAALDEIRASTSRELAELREWVEDQSFSAMLWDVTLGTRIDGVTAMRDLFRDVTVEGCTVDQLASSTRYPTVADLAASQYNVRMLAVRGATMLEIDDQAQWRAI